MDFVKGQMVRSKAGRDKNRTFAVIGIQGQMLFLADGSLRKLRSAQGQKDKASGPHRTVLRGESLATDKQLAAAVKRLDFQRPAEAMRREELV